jgi:hypothetical protein
MPNRLDSAIKPGSSGGLVFAVSVLAVVALIVASGVQAGSPYRFKNRALTERAIAAEFVALARRKEHVRYRVRSIGCAKAGIGRAICAAVADGPNGTERFAITFSCPTDAGINCTIRYDKWPA